MSTTQATLDLIKASRQAPNNELAKAWTQSNSAVSGITAYDLEGPAKQLYPVITPLRNKLPRVVGGVGIQANWRAITGVNVNGLSIGLGQGNRGGVQSAATKDFFAAFKGLGLDDNVTFEADMAARGFDDMKALAVESLLRATMIGEEFVILGGNSSVSFGTTPTPSVSTATTGGSLPASTAYSLIAVALSLEGVHNSSIAGGIPALVIRNNADGSTDSYGGGSAQKSASGTVTTGGGTATNTVSGTVAPVTGAVGYAWFFGPAGSEVLTAITTINSVLITAAGTGTQTAASLPASDNSTNDLIFDGFLSLAAKSGSNAYHYSMPTGTPGAGTPLTANGDGGIVEIDDALKSLWDNYKLSPSKIYVSSQEQKNITAKILASSANGTQRFTIDAKQGALAGGFVVRSYLNPYSMAGAVEIPIEIHPNLAPGTILFFTEELPYPLSNVAAINQMKLRRDYYQIEWPMVSRKYQYGVYFDGVLQSYAPFSLGVITNIANG